MATFLRLLCMAAVGTTLAFTNISIFGWQFWVITVAVLAYGIIQNAEGYKEAAGYWPWEN